MNKKSGNSDSNEKEDVSFEVKAISIIILLILGAISTFVIALALKSGIPFK
ncbi:hypothetical protein [Lactococcus lactis]|uniref:hypothetical protein n=1 Tax=Lactococcus lactis TaxID=1358 RepID=UPI0013A544BF|nr:hypothetical protein [Lactococcus lactis]